MIGCHFARKLLRVGVITGCSIFPATASAVSRAIASVSPPLESDVALEEWVRTRNCEIGPLPRFCWFCALPVSLNSSTVMQTERAVTTNLQLGNPSPFKRETNASARGKFQARTDVLERGV